jgi:hypothetical protein
MAYPIYSAPVRNAETGEFDTQLVGEQVQIVNRGTTTPYPILNAADDVIADSLVTVQTSFCTPTVYIATEAPEAVYLDWYHAGSGARGPVYMEEVSRQAAINAATAASASNTAAQGALAAAQALDSTRMQLAGSAVAQGSAFYGVWTAGAAPTPPSDGKIYWGLEIVP